MATYKRKGSNDYAKEIGRMKQLEFFGESTLEMHGEKRQATVSAVGDVKMLKLTRANFTELLGDLREVIKFNFNQKVLGSMEMFRALDDSDKVSLVESLEEAVFADGTTIIEQGATVDAAASFYIIKSGSVRVTRKDAEGVKDDVITSTDHVIKERLGPGEYFGEMALLSEEPRNSSVTATSDRKSVV